MESDGLQLDRAAGRAAVPGPMPGPGREVAATRDGQRAALETLRLALDEGHVFAALTGPAGVGKTATLDALLAGLKACRVLRIADPAAVTREMAERIEAAALAEAARPGSDQHVALVVDDAHAASLDLLDGLTRLAVVRRSGGRLPQVLLAGQPDLWDRLGQHRFRPLERRIAVRHEMRATAADDPWASVEQALATLPTPAAQAPARPDAPVPYPPPGRFDELLARRANLVEPPADRSQWPQMALVAAVFAAMAVGVGITAANLMPAPAATAPATPAPAAPADPGPPAQEAAAMPAQPPTPSPDDQGPAREPGRRAH